MFILGFNGGIYLVNISYVWVIVLDGLVTLYSVFNGYSS